ncbi:phage protein NinX family protein [Yersinia rochesterensis]|uniref:phage protein NinX family protein n=1 Tax=Yersinia rochesterensis TaxID=1604335 RepID=UPI001643A22B|nr:phage protein NinX family protein [Yersinia rochesterensis]
MKDYSAMSDEDINKLVAGHISFADKVMVGTGQIDYCNNPADAWPIIFRERITLTPKVMGYEWDAISPVILNDDIEHLHTDKNPIRAGMIVFLMMKDRESSHV